MDIDARSHAIHLWDPLLAVETLDVVGVRGAAAGVPGEGTVGEDGGEGGEDGGSEEEGGLGEVHCGEVSGQRVSERNGFGDGMRNLLRGF